MIIKLDKLKEGYYGRRKWKPSRAAARAYYSKMDEIDEFLKDKPIIQSASGDSYYFEIDGQKYRVSNHSVEASDRAAYRTDPITGERIQVRPKYHDGREDDVIYIHAGKTRIIDIYNNLVAGKKLDGRGNVIREKLTQSPSKKVFESAQDDPKFIGAILEFKEGKIPSDITIGKLYPVEKINKYLESEDVAVYSQNKLDGIDGYDKAYVDLVFEYKGTYYRAHLLRYDLGDLYKEYVTNETIEYVKNKVKEYVEGVKSYFITSYIYEVDPINYKRIENIVREDVNKDAEELAISNDLASAIMGAIKSEFDAVNEYNDLIVLAEVLDKPEIAKIAHSIANEEKAHVGELQKALAMIDPTFESSLESGEQEILDIVKESYTEGSLFNLLKKQGKTLGDMREYQYQRNIAKQLGVDLDKVDELILSGKGYDEISEFIYNNADKKEYEKVYHQDDTLRLNNKRKIKESIEPEDVELEIEDKYELVEDFLRDAELEVIKEIIEEYEDDSFLEHIKKDLEDNGKTFETASKEDLLFYIDIDQYDFIFENYVDESKIDDKKEELAAIYNDEEAGDADLDYDWRRSRL